MKKNQKLVSLISLTLVAFFTLSSVASAQTKSLPKGLDENSTFAEIVDWLNKNSFPKARIGMESDGNYNYESNDIPTNGTTYFEEAVFASGFRFNNGGTCQRLDLVNDNIRLIYFGTKYPDPSDGSLGDFRKTNNDQKVFSGELRIPLTELSYKDGKKTKKEKTFWYSKYAYKNNGFGEYFRTIGLIFDKDKMIEKIKAHQENGMQIRVNGSGTNGRDEAFYGSRIFFKFEDKTASEDFDSAFRRLIKVCGDK